MKKLLLVGLLVLSAVGMAATESTQVEVETKLILTGNDLIITPDPDGDGNINAGTSILIDHGSKTAADLNGTSLTTKGDKAVYVRTTTGTLPAGTKVTLGLVPTTTDNNLSNGINTIAHSLTGKVTDVTTPGSLNIAGDNKTASLNVTQAAEAPIKIEMESTIEGTELVGKSNGNYSNTSILSVSVTAN